MCIYNDQVKFCVYIWRYWSRGSLPMNSLRDGHHHRHSWCSTSYLCFNRECPFWWKVIWGFSYFFNVTVTWPQSGLVNIRERNKILRIYCHWCSFKRLLSIANGTGTWTLNLTHQQMYSNTRHVYFATHSTKGNISTTLRKKQIKCKPVCCARVT